MRRRRVFLVFLTVAFLGMSWGCGKGKEGKEGTGSYGMGNGSFSEDGWDNAETSDSGAEGDGEGEEKGNPADGNLLLKGAALKGDVTEFSEAGCNLAPTHEEGGGLAWSAAEGYEDEAEKVRVVYGPDCVFWIAKINTVTAEAVYEPASVEDVKIQTNLALYGTYEEDGSFLADKVYVYRRYMEE